MILSHPFDIVINKKFIKTEYPKKKRNNANGTIELASVVYHDSFSIAEHRGKSGYSRDNQRYQNGDNTRRSTTKFTKYFEYY